MNLLMTINKSSILKVLDDYMMKNSCICFLFLRMSTYYKYFSILH